MERRGENQGNNDNESVSWGIFKMGGVAFTVVDSAHSHQFSKLTVKVDDPTFCVPQNPNSSFHLPQFNTSMPLSTHPQVNTHYTAICSTNFLEFDLILLFFKERSVFHCAGFKASLKISYAQYGTECRRSDYSGVCVQ